MLHLTSKFHDGLAVTLWSRSTVTRGLN